MGKEVCHRIGGAHRGGARKGLVAGLGLLALIGLFMLLEPSRFFGPPRGGLGTGGRPIDHVILIIVDTLRPDVLSCYGSRLTPTPHIDRLARDGIRFTNVFSTAPWTLPSVASIMTGLSPTAHLAVRPDSKLSDPVTTLAESMRDAGYLTAAIGSNVFLKSEYNISQGFLEYDFYPKLSSDGPADISTADLTKKAIAWLEAHRDDDFFLWIHYFDPHLPYEPRPDLLPEETPPDRIGPRFAKIDEVRSGKLELTAREKEWIRELYNGEVRYIDENLGVLARALERLDIYDDALIVFMSDHGEEFWEHGGFEHGHTLYNELLRVPLIIKLPGVISAGERSAMVSIQGVTPTVLDLCGIDYGNELAVHSLAPLLVERAAGMKTPPIVSTGMLYGEEQESVIMDGMKYIRYPGTNREELYRLDLDPGESVSVSRSSPDLALRAADVLNSHRAASEILRTHYGATDNETVDIDPEIRLWLESLGYLR